MNILYQSDFSKPGAVDWQEINPYTSGSFEAQNGAFVLTKGSGSPPCPHITPVGLGADYSVEVVPSNFSRINILVRCTDYQNYIMVFTSGNGAHCARMRNGTWANIGQTDSFPVGNGDRLSVEVENRHPLILVSFLVNGERKYTWALQEETELMAGGIAIQAENIEQTFIDKVTILEL